jgi:hypothetical protein
LNAELVVKLLEANGEYERAQDRVLVDQMVEVCQSSTGLLDLQAWTNALAGDVQEQWDVGCEDRISTHVYDVWGYETYREMDQVLGTKEERKQKIEQNIDSGSQMAGTAEKGAADANYTIDRKRTQTNIDYVIDSHCSISLVASIWVFYICSVLLYTAMFQSLPALQSACEPSFPCQLLGTIYVWMTFAILLITMGFIVVLPLSMGNNPAERSPWRNLCVALLTAIYCWVPFAVVEWYEDNSVEVCMPFVIFYQS